MNLDKLIGQTPLIKINYKYKGIKNAIYAKLEYYNLTGSIKDRIVYYIINEAIKDGSLKANMPIIEATSGNTGISISAIGAISKHPVHIFMPEWVSKERKKIMEMYGATVHIVKKEDGGFKKALILRDELVKKLNGFSPMQFENINNIKAHYLYTAKEIITSLPNINSFTSGLGTGGTLMGIAKKLKEYNQNIKIIALEPDKMPLLSQNKIISNHKIEGIGDDFIPPIVDKSLIDNITLINDDDAINMAKILAQKLGLGVGISSGANFLASVINNQKDNVMATIFVDDNKKYISTDLAKPINNNTNYISNKIELIDFEVL